MAAYSSSRYHTGSSTNGGRLVGVAQRAVALDLMLRTFMNSPDFQPNNIRMWEGIAKLVPGVTTQQVVYIMVGLISLSFSLVYSKMGGVKVFHSIVYTRHIYTHS